MPKDFDTPMLSNKKRPTYLNKCINMQHESLSSADDKLIDTCNCMGPIKTFYAMNLIVKTENTFTKHKNQTRF